MHFVNEKGFTLIEVVVALMLLSFIAVAMVQIYNSGLFGILRSGERLASFYEAQSELEEAFSREDEAIFHEAVADVPRNMLIPFGDFQIFVFGHELLAEQSHGGQTVQATIFVPDVGN